MKVINSISNFHFVKLITKIANIGLIASLFLTSCRKDPQLKEFLTENVVVIVVDGARYSEVWGDTAHQYIPKMYNEMAPEGIYFTNFLNNGPTNTNAGHTAILTGVYQEINNNGLEAPQNPSYIQKWLEASGDKNNSAWIFASKDKIEVLKDCQQADWSGKYVPNTDCGNDGLGTGYRPDSITLRHTIDTMTKYHPQMVFINFRQPDFNAHQGSWSLYENGLLQSDDYVYQLWNFINSNDFYKDRTSLFVTNDHGRHLDSVATGFVSHGDGCYGCRHISLYAYGPDFRKGQIISAEWEQIDIPITVAKLLGFRMNYTDGKVISELFN